MKPCPFCGGNNVVVRQFVHVPESLLDDAMPDADRYAWVVTCSGCAADGPWRKSEPAAVYAWNRRPDPSMTPNQSTPDDGA